MDKPRKQPHAHLFTMRVWLEDLGDGQAEWRGSVKNVASGEQRAFRQWIALAQVMQALLPTAPLIAPAHHPTRTADFGAVRIEDVDEMEA